LTAGCNSTPIRTKSGIAYLGGKRLLAIDALAGHPAFSSYERMRVDPTESYAAKCVRR